MLTYAGVQLGVPEEDVLRWVHANLTVRDAYERTRRSWAYEFNTLDPLPGRIGDEPIELNVLRWPNGASRWSTFFGVAGAARTAQIVAQCFPGSGYVPQPLVMTKDCGCCDGETEDSITATMYLLPPRPFSAQNGGELFLLPMVDQRYFWWSQNTGDLTGAVSYSTTTTIATQTHTYAGGDSGTHFNRTFGGAMTDTLPTASGAGGSFNIEIENPTAFPLTLLPGSGTIDSQPSYLLQAGDRISIYCDGSNFFTGWAWWIKTLASKGGASVVFDAAVNSHYQTPTVSDVRNKYDPVPPWLDTFAWNAGMRVYCTLDGTVHLGSPTGALPDLSRLVAGQQFAGTPSSSNCPASGVAVFPSYTGDVYNGAITTKTATGTGAVGTAVLQSPLKDSLTGAQLQAVATQWTADFCSWQLGAADVRLPGIISVVPNGLYGNILWTYLLDDESTRVELCEYPASRWHPCCCCQITDKAKNSGTQSVGSSSSAALTTDTAINSAAPFISGTKFTASSDGIYEVNYAGAVDVTFNDFVSVAPASFELAFRLNGSTTQDGGTFCVELGSLVYTPGGGGSSGGSAVWDINHGCFEGISKFSLSKGDYLEVMGTNNTSVTARVTKFVLEGKRLCDQKW